MTEYAKMIKKAKKLARQNDLEEIRAMMREHFQWAGAIRDVWEFEQKLTRRGARDASRKAERPQAGGGGGRPRLGR
ncbi:MAG: hypothetical protein DRJ03_13140 [Chloroflexi bacterium]|nr:MAG: hypothetical protein DRJ03_13140 [Chloroflexota bacterium]